MKKSINKIASVVLLSSLFISNNIYAKSFSDVKADGNYKWAYSAIDSLSNKGIFGGYPNGTFKPERPVSFLEIMQIIKNIKNPGEEELAAARNNFKNVCSKYKVEPWAEDAVCYCLNNNTITEKTLSSASAKGLLRDKNIVYPDRNTVTVYFGRAFGFSGSGDSTLLKHKDIDKIPAMTKGFLSELVKAKIYSDSGSDGYFNGNKFIRRAEVAVIADKAINYLNSSSGAAGNNTEKSADNVKGTIDYITLSGEESTISINKKTYRIRVDNVDIIDSTQKYNGDILSLKNAEIKAEVSNGEVKTIEILKLENSENENNSVIIEEPRKDSNDVEISGRVIDSTDYNGKYEIEIFIYESNNSNYVAGNTIKVMSDKNYGINETVNLKGKVINNQVENLEIIE